MGRRRQIDRAAILDAALQLADEDGLDAVTMHAVAQRLQVTAMALDRHMDGKGALLAPGGGEGPPPGRRGGRRLTGFPPPAPGPPGDARLTVTAEAIRSAAR